MSNPLLKKLERRGKIAADEREALLGVTMRVRSCRFGEVLVEEDTRLTESTLLLEGFTARTKTLRSGKRQITAIHVMGDFIDLPSFLLKQIDHTIEALTPCTVAGVPHTELERLTDRFPNLTRMLWLTTVIDSAIHRAWLVAMGRQSSLGQLAHFVCEMYLRLQVVEQTDDLRFRLPLTQVELSDVMGLSSVHVNRVIQELRTRNLLQYQDQVVTIVDWDRLIQVAEFDPTYLSLHRDRP